MGSPKIIFFNKNFQLIISFMYFEAKKNVIMAMVNSTKKLVIAAPFSAKIGINVKSNKRHTPIAIKTAIITSLSFPMGVRTCIEKMFDKPIIRMIGERIWIRTAAPL